MRSEASASTRQEYTASANTRRDHTASVNTSHDHTTRVSTRHDHSHSRREHKARAHKQAQAPVTITRHTVSVNTSHEHTSTRHDHTINHNQAQSAVMSTQQARALDTITITQPASASTRHPPTPHHILRQLFTPRHKHQSRSHDTRDTVSVNTSHEHTSTRHDHTINHNQAQSPVMSTQQARALVTITQSASASTRHPPTPHHILRRIYAQVVA